MSLASSVGLVSGLPVDDIISQLLALRQRSIIQLQNRQTSFSQQQQAYIQINNGLLGLRTSAEGLSDLGTFQQRLAVSGDDSSVSVTSTSGAALGSYTVDVLQLASAHRLGAQGFADTGTTPVAAGDGFFSFKIGTTGATTSIAVNATTTLADLREAINAAGTDVTASIINDGSATNPNRLVLTSKKTGASNRILITQNDTALNFATTSIEAATANADNTYLGAVTSSGTYTGTDSRRIVIDVTTAGDVETAQFRVSTDGGLTFGPADEFTASATPVDIGDGVLVDFSAGTFAAGDRFSIDVFAPEIRAAQDAILKVDGVTLTRETNSVDNAVEGVTFNLLKPTASTVSVSLSQDTALARDKVEGFVEEYNSVMKNIAAATAFNAETGVRGILLGDSGVRSVQQTLSRIATSPVPGLSSNEINSLASIGISVFNDGTLSIDASKLDNALATDIDSVAKVFATVGTASSTKIEYLSAGANTQPGTYAVNITQAAEQAYVESNQDFTGPLAATETLTITIGSVNHLISVAAGLTLDQAVDSINSQLQSKGLSITATNEANRLRLSTEAYGSSASISVVSDQSGASADQLGIGTTVRNDTGLDVTGTIGGQGAKGVGQTLKGGVGTKTEGLELLISATEAGFVGNITFSSGVGIQLESTLESLTDPENGLLTSRVDGIDASIKDLDEQVENLEERIQAEGARLRAQFGSLEILLSQFQSTSTFLTNQLSQLAAINAQRAN